MRFRMMGRPDCRAVMPETCQPPVNLEMRPAATGDSDGKPTKEKGQVDGVHAWSLVNAYARADGGFTVIY